MNVKQTIENGLMYHHYANTAYLFAPKTFMEYRTNNPSQKQSFLAL